MVDDLALVENDRALGVQPAGQIGCRHVPNGLCASSAGRLPSTGRHRVHVHHAIHAVMGLLQFSPSSPSPRDNCRGADCPSAGRRKKPVQRMPWSASAPVLRHSRWARRSMPCGPQSRKSEARVCLTALTASPRRMTSNRARSRRRQRLRLLSAAAEARPAPGRRRRAGAAQPRHQPQQPAHGESRRDDARQPPARRGIDRKSEARRTARISASAPLPARTAMLAVMPTGAEDLAEYDADNECYCKPLSVAISRCQRVVVQRNAGDRRLYQHMGGQPKRKPRLSACAVAAVSDAGRDVVFGSMRTTGSRTRSVSVAAAEPNAEFETGAVRMRDPRSRCCCASSASSSGTSTAPMVMLTMPSGSHRGDGEIQPRDRRGDVEVIMAPATTSICGEALGDHAGEPSCRGACARRRRRRCAAARRC